MVFGRVAERATIDEVLQRAREGRSGALVIRGEPGIGKSALLKYATERAKDLTLLTARGYESESEIPFAGLADLLRPVLPLLTTLPAPQAAALQSAMSLGPPAGGDRFSVCAATIGMLAAAAADEPLLVVIDDLHWLDVSSREAVLFAARRLGADGIALLMAIRPGEERSYAGITELLVEGLGETEAGELFEELLPASSEELRRRIYSETAGNPLGIRELSEAAATAAATAKGAAAAASATAGPSMVAPRRSEETARIPVQSSLARALGSRLAELPERTRRALMLVAAGSGADADVVLRAAREAGLGLVDFAPAERAGLLDVDERRIGFRHPLMRTVLYGDAPMHERSTAHAALAAVLAGVPGDVAQDGRAWHLAAATVPPDDDVAVLLTAAAGRARRRGGNLEAARAYEQAARFGTISSRAGLLLRAARCWQLAGRTNRILPLLEEALPLSEGDARLRAMIRHMAGYVGMWRALPKDGLREMVEGAREVEEVDPGRAAMMYADAALAHFMLGEPVPLMAVARRSFEVSRGADDASRLVASVAYAASLVINGQRAEGLQLLESVRPALLEVDPIARAQELAHAAFVWMWLEDYATAEALLERIVGRARETGAVGVLPQALSMVSEISFRMGRWPRARAAAQESVTLAGETRQANLYGFYFVARGEAMAGRAEASANLARTVEQAQKHQAGCMDLFIGHTLGQLALGAGDLDEAIARLEAVAALPVARQTRDQSIVPWAFDLVEAYARAGRSDEARALLDRYAVGPPDSVDLTDTVRLVTDSPVPVRTAWLEAMTHRCLGLLASREEMSGHFERALAAHDRCEMPFERARTLLAFGERLRRLRSRGPARLRLRKALEIFDQLDAATWVARARAELAATGETTSTHRPGTGAAADLTPQELQVAMVVAGGASNQEAAASLFLSPKTIEYHLSNIYRKTNLKARGDLKVLLAVPI